MNPPLVLDVIRFELARSMTGGRLAIWLALVAFPVVLISIIKVSASIIRPEAIGFTMYFLIPEVVCLLGLLLWATPAIATEIEGQTWTYLAMRRSGRIEVLLGKYLTAVVWTFAAAIVSISLCVVIVAPDEMLRSWIVLSILALLSCFAHAAIYLLIGVVFHRRTMVTAVVYTLVIEYGLSLIPAVANKMTVNYRLRGLLADWMNWDDVRSLAEAVFGSEPASTHLTALAVLTVAFVAVAILRLATGEYPTQQDG